jgi:hypothetical protein
VVKSESTRDKKRLQARAETLGNLDEADMDQVIKTLSNAQLEALAELGDYDAET